MHKDNEYKVNDNNNHYPSKIDKKFLDKLSEFIQSVESEMDIMLPGITSLQFLTYYKIIDYVISQKLTKNIIIRLLCPFDEDSARLTKLLVPFIGYRSIKPSLPKTLIKFLVLYQGQAGCFFFFSQYASSTTPT